MNLFFCNKLHKIFFVSLVQFFIHEVCNYLNNSSCLISLGILLSALENIKALDFLVVALKERKKQGILLRRKKMATVYPRAHSSNPLHRQSAVLREVRNAFVYIVKLSRHLTLYLLTTVTHNVEVIVPVVPSYKLFLKQRGERCFLLSIAPDKCRS